MTLKHRPQATPELQERLAKFAQYIRENHPALSEHDERRAAYWQEVKGDAMDRRHWHRAQRLLAAWDRQNPPPLSWERQAEIRDAFLKTYRPPVHSGG